MRVDRQISPEKAEKLAEVARLDRMGYSAGSIAAAVNVSEATVYAYLKEISKLYVDTMLKDRESLVARKLAEYRDVKLAAWEAYEKSKMDYEIEREEWTLPRKAEGEKKEAAEQTVANKGKESKGKPVKSGKTSREKLPPKLIPKRHKKPLDSPLMRKLELIKVKSVKTRSGRLPGAEYLNLLLTVLKAERELQGLDEAIKLDLKTQVIDWAALMSSTPQHNPLTIIDQRISEELAKIPSEHMQEILCQDTMTVDEPHNGASKNGTH